MILFYNLSLYIVSTYSRGPHGRLACILLNGLLLLLLLLLLEFLGATRTYNNNTTTNYNNQRWYPSRQ